MAINAFTDIHYETVMRDQDLDETSLKSFLLRKLDDISALIMEIDIFIAGNRRYAILIPLKDIEEICRQINAERILDEIKSLKSLLNQTQTSEAQIAYQERLNRILNEIRQTCFSYAETIQQDL